MSEIDNTPMRIRIATYLFLHRRAIISVEAYAPRQDRWFVLHSGFPTSEEAKTWVNNFVNTSRQIEITDVEIPVKETPDG